MAKRKHSSEWMLERVNEYLNGEGSYDSIAKANGIGRATLVRWVAAYRFRGIEAFSESSGNNSYSSIFKISCVKAVLSGRLSAGECAAKYGISNDSVLRRWISEYNANRELGVSHAAYYKWLNREIPEEELENQRIANLIIEYDDRFGHILGYRQMTLYINHFNGTDYKVKRIQRVMKVMGIHAIIRQKRKQYTYATPLFHSDRGFNIPVSSSAQD